MEDEQSSIARRAGASVGAMVGENLVLDLARAAKQRNVLRDTPPDSMLSILRAGQEILEPLDALISDPPEEALKDLSSLRLEAPLPIPEQIRDFANYEGHCLNAVAASMRLRAAAEPDPDAALKRMQESGAYGLPSVWYEIPLYYKGNRFACNGHDSDVIWPEFAENLDYELELAAVIGAHGKDISIQEARTHIFGYTIFNDFSARDVQARWEGQFRMGPAKGKDFDTGNCFGPCLVTRDEIPDPYNLEMSVRVNGVERGRAISGGAQHDFETCIAQVSRCETIYPGEIFGLGTPEGGCGFESLTWLEPGDVIELEIERVGVLRNRIVRAPNQRPESNSRGGD